MKIGYIIFMFILLASCQSSDQHQPENNSTEKSIFEKINYAKGFTIENRADCKVITLKDPWKGETTSYKYVLYKNEEPEGYEDAMKIKVPIRSIACMSLTHIAFIESLNRENSIVALSGCDYTNSNKIIDRIKNKQIIEIGSEQSINYELLVERQPDIIMCYGINESSGNYINKFKKLGLISVLNSEYMETHPLGKAEWIKFVAAFYDMEEQADSIFNVVEKEYLGLLKLTEKIKDRPTVFTGMPWNGTWYVPGGRSFQAQLFKDAGANYLWSDNNEKSSMVKSKEVVIDKAYNADFWLNQNSYNSVSSIIGFDGRLAGFYAIKQNNLYNNNKRLNQFSGNDYWESGTVKPQVILKDLIEIFHPEILDHRLYYYKKLE